MTPNTFRSLEEKVKFVESLSIGAKLNYEKKNADNGITKNKYRNGTSDEVNQVVYDNFKDTYLIDVYTENGFDHIRMYNKEDKNLYVLIREGTYKEQIESKEDESLAVHYLKAYAYMNWHVSKVPIKLTGQLMLFGEDNNEIGTHKEHLVQQKVREVIGNVDVELVHIITYDVSRGDLLFVKSRIPSSELRHMPIYEEDMSEFIVTYNNQDETVGSSVKVEHTELSDEMQKQIITGLLKLKGKEKDNSDK
ncbi:hypothetical protein DQG23_40630 [Paenibacillus contaminans]|uniref:Uncharacterized protein n=1 Tax=Paenibacillus contaminans TaxID=450362 RepID=A0A329LPW0_9BACL|nr:hypothetical protein DQG23_40630 [Paenibacillus contaminans]